MADMTKDDGMEVSFKCPACGEDLVVETKGEDMNEDSGDKNMPSMEEAQSMPLDQLRSRLPKKSEE